MEKPEPPVNEEGEEKDESKLIPLPKELEDVEKPELPVNEEEKDKVPSPNLLTY